MKILILVPDGVGVRNYLFSSFTSGLLKTGNEVLIYHKLSKSAINEIKKNKPEIKNFKEIPNFVEKPKARLFRELLTYARLLRNEKVLQNKTILKFWNPSKKGVKKKFLYFISEMLGSVFSKSYLFIKKGDKLYENEISKSKMIKQVKATLLNYNPDIVLNLHQRSPLTAPIITEARNLNFKTATVIFSWDNVPKARLISRYDYYYVWSELMKNELKLLYPEILNSQINIVGTPQFEFYFNEEFYYTKDCFFKTYNLDLNKKTLCFSGNDSSSPYEANYLNDICEELMKLDDNKRPQLIFRRSPVDKSDRFDEILNKYKELVVSIDPDWRVEKGNDASFSSSYPSYNDIKLLVNTIKYSDLAVNLGSTMALDAAVLDKPCLYLNYNPTINPNFKVEDVYEFQHFRSMNNIEAVGWINNKNEISSKIIEGLNYPNKVAKDRKEWLNKIIKHPLEKNSINLANLIIEKCTSAT